MLQVGQAEIFNISYLSLIFCREDAGVIRIGIQKFLHIQLHAVTAKRRDVQDLGVHADGIFRASLHAKTAVNAFTEVNIEAGRTLFNFRVWMFLGHNVNAVSRTNRFAHHAGHAARGTVFPLGQPMAGAQTAGGRPFFFGIKVGHAGAYLFEKTNGMKKKQDGVLPEVCGSYPDPFENFREV